MIQPIISDPVPSSRASPALARQPSQDVVDWRCANAGQIASALLELRRATLHLFDAYAAAGALQVPQHDELNPPLWELGHLGWFQEFWIGRNLQRDAGVRCQPGHSRLPSVQPGADDWYNSSVVAHAARWSLPLLDAPQCKAYLAATLERTLALLASAGSSDDALYFYRLVMCHEAMHLEAAVYMAQALGLPISGAVGATNLVAACAIPVREKSSFFIKNRPWTLGSAATGFAFDNELGGHRVDLADFEIDAAPVSWAQYMAYVLQTGCDLPRYVREAGGAAAGASQRCFEQQVFGQWQPMAMDQCAVHLSYPEVQAYCQHVGRRLPSEAEWECAALELGADFAWGQVWEWTSSPFAPYPGFAAHPYRDYSEPWFHTRPVLRGACAATHPVMRSAKYRNYFMPQRSDIYAGFRTCAV